MAENISQKITDKAFCNAYYVPNIKSPLIKKIFKLFLIKTVSFYRVTIFYIKKLFLKLFLIFINNNNNTKCSVVKIRNINFKEKSDELRKNGWCYIENFLDEQNYENIKQNWPKNIFLKFKNNPIKFYYIGLEYLSYLPEKYLDNDKKIISLYPRLRDYYNYLLSSELSIIIQKLVNETSNFECHSIACSSAWPKSFLAPHVDSISLDNDINKTINCIHFIDGNNDNIEFSGATGIYEDNEFKKKIFIPKSLKNSLLIYNSKKNFYHGFDIMKKNTFRKTVMFQFFKKT